MKDYNKLINFKWGTQPFSPSNDGTSHKWFFYKPITGNLAPSPQQPFSSFCSVLYGGGYPTGYGSYCVCSSACPRKASGKLKGITHFAPSGTGFIGNFYNYFLIKPSVKSANIVSENYFIGGYNLVTDKYTVNAVMGQDNVHYVIKSKSPAVIYPSYKGLNIGTLKPSFGTCTFDESSGKVTATADYGTITIYWCITADNGTTLKVCDNTVVVDGNKSFTLSYSLVDISSAVNNCKVKSIEPIWNKYLSKVDITADDKTERLFYTALYNSIKRPFVCGQNVYDFATLWDCYKTQLPLIFVLYPDIANVIVNGLTQLQGDNGQFHNARLMENTLTDRFDNQSVCIANILLSTAKLYGLNVDESVYDKQVADIKSVLNNSLPLKPRFTHNLDLLDAICALRNAYGAIPYDLENVLHNLVLELFDDDGVLLKTDGATYYEGSNVNYSYRVSASTLARLAITNKAKLVKGLDRFFGFDQKPCKFFNKHTLSSIVTKYGNKVKRFEGLNNEPDMESPYMYGLVGQREKQNIILNAVMDNNFGIGNDGLCGNDDSGGLSSWYVWNALGLFPVVGTDKLLVGCPKVDKAVIKFDKPFTVKVVRQGNGCNVSSAVFNGEPLEDFTLKVSEMINGGTLVINMD